PALAYAGQPLTYTLIVSNNGAYGVNGVIISDTLPAPLSAAGGSGWDCGQTAGVLTCTVPYLAPGDSLTATATMTAPIATGPITNTAVVGYQVSDNLALLDATPVDNRSTLVTMIAPRFDLAITKTADRAAAVPGTPLTYTLIAQNHGPNGVTGALISDIFPAELTNVTWQCAAGSGATCADLSGSGPINQSVDLLAGDILTYTATGLIDPSAAGLLTNTATITKTVSPSDGLEVNPDNNQASAVVTLTPQIDLRLSQSDAPDPVVAGSGIGNLTYVMTVTNDGPSAAGNIQIGHTLTMPAGVNLETITPESGTLAGSVWTIPTLPVGATTRLTATLTVGPTALPAAEAITSTAVLLSADQAILTPAAVTETTSIIVDIDLLLTVTGPAAPVVAGSGAGNLTYTATITNQGLTTVSGLVVSNTLALPAGVVLDSVTPTAGSIWDGAATWTVGDLAGGDTKSLLLTLTAGAEVVTGTVVANTAVLVAAPDDFMGLMDTAVVTITNQADLAISLSAAPDPVAAGTPLTYTISVTNSGPSVATNVTVTTSPGNHQLNHATAGCLNDPNGQPLCELGTLQAGESISYTLTAVIDPAANGSQTSLAATVTGVVVDPNPFNNSANLTTIIDWVADLALTVSDYPDPALPRQPVTYTLTLTNYGPSSADVEANYSFAPFSVSTLFSGDCDFLSSTVQTVAAGASHTCFVVATINQDLAQDTVITFTAGVEPWSNFVTDPDLSNNVVTETTTIRGLELIIGDVAQVEGDSGLTDFTFVVTRSHNTTNASVDFMTVDDTAVAGSDYQTTGGTLSFSPNGPLTQTISVPVIGNTIYEADKTFLVQLTNPLNAVMVRAEGVGTILNDDAPPALSIADVTALENSGLMTFTVSLDGVSGLPALVDYTTLDGTAVAGSDYITTTGTLTFPSGTISQTVSVPLIDNNLLDGSKTFTVTLSNPISATIAHGSALGTILDDEEQPALSISDSTVTAPLPPPFTWPPPPPPTVTAVFTVAISHPYFMDVSFEYATRDDTAVAGMPPDDDYEATNGNLTIPAGQTTAVISVTVYANYEDQPDKTFFVDLSNPVYATLGDAEGVGTILNQAPEPSVFSYDEWVWEDAGEFDIYVTLVDEEYSSVSSQKIVSVDYYMEDITAVTDIDYQPISGTITFMPGERELLTPLFTIIDRPDDYYGDRTFALVFTNTVNTNLNLGDRAIITIRDRQPKPLIEIGPVTVAQGELEASFPVTLSRAVAVDVSVSYDTLDSTAVAGRDYTAITGTLTIPAGITQTGITVPLIPDPTANESRAFSLRLSQPVNACLDDTFSWRCEDDIQTTATILLEGVAGLTAVSDSPTTLGQTTRLTATISSGSNVSYSWTLGDGNSATGATASHSYGAAGTYTATVTATNTQGSQQAVTFVTIINEAPVADPGPDQMVEINQSVTLDGSNSSDPDGHLPLSYGWAQTGGTAVTLSGNHIPMPTFTTPLNRTLLTFTLVVTDSFGLASMPDTVVVTVQQPDIVIDKQVNTAMANVGDTITYTYALTNTGDVVLSQINPVDDQLGPLFTDPVSLNVGQAVSQTVTYTIVEADLPGPLLNTVVVSGTSPAGNVVDDSDLATVILSSQPALHLIKEANVNEATIGQVITYTYTVMNVGDVTLTDVTAVDTPLGPIALLTHTLPSLATTSGILTHTVSEADLPGPLTNSALASGMSAGGEVVTATTELSISLTAHPGLLVELSASPLLAQPGSVVTYTLTLLNSGNVTLHTLSSLVTVGDGFSLPDSLAPGGSLTTRYGYTVLATDLPGPLTNSVTITALPTAHESLMVTTAVSVSLQAHTIYLPLLLNQFVAAPDLVVHDLIVSSKGITVVIGNIGNTAVVTPFWVDVYINPDPAPTAVNQTWQLLAAEGLVWGVTAPALPLLPGQTMALTMDGPYYRPQLSLLTGEIEVGTAVYAQVDSASTYTSYGAVHELSEILGLPYNNIFGPLLTTSASRPSPLLPRQPANDPPPLLRPLPGQ
ncbi:MAG: Calx-beta domain-containing protein, partial [Chloroflexota bacterium]